MNVLSILRPAPIKEEIQDASVVKTKYKYWRFRTLYAMYIGYVFYYFTRKSFTFAIPALKEHFNLSMVQLGCLGSILSIAYGISKFVSGVMGDKSNPRYFMSIGLILTGVFNIFFGLSSSFFFFAVFWGLNGWFQGWGWPGCAKLLTHWYSHSERGRWWSIWNTSHNLGGAIIPIVIGLIIEYFNWRFALILPGVLCIIVGLFLINRLRDTPQSLGLPPIEKHNKDYSNQGFSKKESLPVKEILMKYIISNPFIWMLSSSYFFVYVVRTAINDWSPLYLIETKGYSYLDASSCMFWFEIGGIFGSLLAGWASDKIFLGRRNPINVIYALLIPLVLYGFWSGSGVFYLRDASLIFLVGFLIFGPQMLIGMAAAELSHKNAAATATGFAGCFGYLGSASAGAPLGGVVSVYGWDHFFVVIGVISVLSALFLIPMWSLKGNPKYA